MRPICILIHVKRRENSWGSVYLKECLGNNCKYLIHLFKYIFQLNSSKGGLTKSSSLTVLWNQCMDVNSKFYSNLRSESSTFNSFQWEEYYILHYYRKCCFQINTLRNLHFRRIYLVRPRMTTMKAIADHINSDRNINFKRKYSIIFVPRKVGKFYFIWRKKEYCFCLNLCINVVCKGTWCFKLFS